MPPLILFGGWRLAFQAQLIFALGLIFVLCVVRPHYDRNRDRTRKVFSLRGPLRLIGLLRELPEMRPLSIAAFIYSGTQLCFGAFIVTQLVRVFGQEGYHFASAVALVTFQLSGITTRIVLGIIADALISARWLLVAQGALMTVAAIVAAGYGSNWPYWLIILNCALAGATASGYTGLAFAEFARMGGGQRIAEATGLGAALMFFGVAAMTPLFRLGIDIFDGYTVPYLSVAVLTGASAILLAFGTRK